MEYVYSFKDGEAGAAAFQRKLFTAWLMDMQDNDCFYDIVIRYAMADRLLSLGRSEEDTQQEERQLREGECFLIVSSAQPCEGVLNAAEQAFGEGCEGPFTCPVPSAGFTVYNTVTFKR